MAPGGPTVTDPRALLERTRTVAVVGCSTHPGKAAHQIPRQLQQAGYRVIPVHPSAETILGERVYRTLAEIPEPIDLVDVFRPSPEAAGIARQAVAVGAKAVWLQSGIRSEEAARIAEEAGLDYVENRCTGADVARFGIRHEVGE